VLSPSADRVAPPCPHYGTCGGCDLQHFEASAQLAHKRAVVLETLARAARLEPRIVEPSIESPPFHYRTRARLAVDARERGKPVVGFREGASADVVPIAHCHVLHHALAGLPSALSGLVAEMEAPRAIGHIDLALSETADATFPVVGLRLARDLSERDRARCAAFAVERRAYFALDDGLTSASYLHRPCDDAPAYRLPGFDLRIAFDPGDFVQGNAGVNRAFVGRVVDWVQLAEHGEVLDAFCGLGNFSLAIARNESGGTRVLGVEVDRGMVERARENAKENRVGGVEFLVRDLQDAEIALPRKRFDVAVLDPPRTGARALIERFAAERVPVLIYASCMASALGRDARVLADAGYALDRLALVDMFPQTSHVEALARFVLEHKKRKTR